MTVREYPDRFKKHHLIFNYILTHTGNVNIINEIYLVLLEVVYSGAAAQRHVRLVKR